MKSVAADVILISLLKLRSVFVKSGELLIQMPQTIPSAY